MRSNPFRTRTLLGAVAALALTGPTSVLAQDSGANLNYQGRLDENGAPFSGTVDITVAAFTAAIGGVKAIPNTTLADVVITDGLFSIEVPIDSAVVLPQGIFLELTIDKGTGPVTLTPRQKYTPVPAAVQASGARIASNDNVTFTSYTSVPFTANNQGTNTVIQAGSVTQTFTAAVGGKLASVSVEVGFDNPPAPSDLLLTIYEGPEAVGTPLFGPATLNQGPGGASLGVTDGPALGLGAVYTLVISPFESGGGPINTALYGASTGDRYPEGASSLGGSIDLGFSVLVETPDLPGIYTIDTGSMVVTGALTVVGATNPFSDSVDLPPSSIEASEIRDEPGVSRNAPDSGIITSTSYGQLADTAIAAPGPGYVLALYTADFSVSHTTGTPSSYDIDISSQPNNGSNSGSQIYLISSELPTAGYVQPFTISRLFRVRTYDFFAVGRKRLGTSPTANLERGRLTLQYFPTEYTFGGTPDVDGVVDPN
ncbi:MAG: hypothetical protein AAGB51_10925 [Planctomycetota bacterium]